MVSAKCLNAKKAEDGRFELRFRLIDLSKADRERLMTAMIRWKI
jgi:hypothetical protein